MSATWEPEDVAKLVEQRDYIEHAKDLAGELGSHESAWRAAMRRFDKWAAERRSTWRPST